MEVRSALLWPSIHPVICLLFRQDGGKRPYIWVCRGKFAADGIARALKLTLRRTVVVLGFDLVGYTPYCGVLRACVVRDRPHGCHLYPRWKGYFPEAPSAE
jgi:hypothetical protein